MSAYATLAELKDRLGSDATGAGIYEQCTDRIGAKIGNDGVGQKLLDDAEVRIHGMVARRYLTPINVSAAPDLAALLNDYTLTIAAYLAYQRNAKMLRRVPEELTKEYERTLKYFRDVASGTCDLPAAAPLPTSVAAGPQAEAVGGGRVFTDEALDGI